MSYVTMVIEKSLVSLERNLRRSELDEEALASALALVQQLRELLES